MNVSISFSSAPVFLLLPSCSIGRDRDLICVAARTRKTSVVGRRFVFATLIAPLGFGFTFPAAFGKSLAWRGSDDNSRNEEVEARDGWAKMFSSRACSYIIVDCYSRKSDK